MDKIVLKPEDFERLDISCGGYDYTNQCEGTNQFVNNFNCPIANALRRQGFKDICVSTFKIEVKPKFNWMLPFKSRTSQEFVIKGWLLDVERCRKELLAGATEAYIEVINN